MPENQTLRPWDNLPRKALSQQITSNRVVYGNYTQGYNPETSIPNLIAIIKIEVAIYYRIVILKMVDYHL